LELIDEILGFLKRDDLFASPTWRSGPFVTPFELKPEDFMRFAEEDLKEKSERSLVNALSNIKRAIDCRIASLLYFFGILKKAKKENWSFPQSSDFLLKIGVIAPSILKKINTKRNQLEHDFKKPTCDEVTDFLDVASMFLGVTNRFFQKAYTGEFEITPDDEGLPWLGMKLEQQEGLIEFEFHNIEGKLEKLKVSVDNEDNYAKALSCVVKAIVRS
jgi:hypothetical protein